MIGFIFVVAASLIAGPIGFFGSVIIIIMLDNQTRKP